MKLKRFILFAILFLVFISGCSGHHGRIGKQTGTTHTVSLVELEENRDGYDIYSCTRNGRWAAGVIFDPKNNDTKIVGDHWIKIEGQETLSRSINEINIVYRNVKVHNIEGPDGRVFGYIYYPLHLTAGV